MTLNEQFLNMLDQMTEQLTDDNPVFCFIVDLRDYLVKNDVPYGVAGEIVLSLQINKAASMFATEPEEFIHDVMVRYGDLLVKYIHLFNKKGFTWNAIVKATSNFTLEYTNG